MKHSKRLNKIDAMIGELVQESCNDRKAMSAILTYLCSSLAKTCVIAGRGEDESVRKLDICATDTAKEFRQILSADGK